MDKAEFWRDARRDSHVIEREMLRPAVQENEETVPLTAPPAKFSRTPLGIRAGAPALGAHNDEVLAELGMDAATRRRLRESKII